MKKVLERVQLTDTKVNLVMPEKVLNQIKYLCREIAKVEWSGVLFYKVEGSIRDVKNMVITLEEILPMDKGTSAYTEYEFGTAFVTHMMENEHLEDCKMGHIHSHNTMSVFFSGTDMEELDDNAANHNFYLSLIVNNFMDFCAKLCFVTETKDKQIFNFTGKDENGAEYVYSSESFVVNTKKLIIYDCNIICPNQLVFVEDSFKEKVASVIKDADDKAALKALESAKKTTSYSDFTGYSFYSPNKQVDIWDEVPGKGRSVRGDDDFWGKDKKDKIKGGKAPYTTHKVTSLAKAKNTPKKDSLADATLEDFVMFILNVGKDNSDNNTVAITVAYFKTYNIDAFKVANAITDRYVELYHEYFNFLTPADRTSQFLSILSYVLKYLGDEPKTELYTKIFLNTIIVNLNKKYNDRSTIK